MRKGKGKKQKGNKETKRIRRGRKGKRRGKEKRKRKRKGKERKGKEEFPGFRAVEVRQFED